MLLVIEPCGQREGRTEREGRELYQRMLRYSEALERRGLLSLGQSLKSETARLTVRSGSPTIVDGPFAEAKEMVGGFFLLNCDTREQALELARECPAAQWATIEVRELGPCFQ